MGAGYRLEYNRQPTGRKGGEANVVSGAHKIKNNTDNNTAGRKGIETRGKMNSKPMCSIPMMILSRKNDLCGIERGVSMIHKVLRASGKKVAWVEKWKEKSRNNLKAIASLEASARGRIGQISEKLDAFRSIWKRQCTMRFSPYH